MHCPQINIIGSSTANAAMNAAKKSSSPIIIQYSNGGAIFNAGKHIDNTNNRAAVIGAVAGALHIHTLAKLYGVSVILHTDHCQRKIISWVDGLLLENEAFY